MLSKSGRWVALLALALAIFGGGGLGAQEKAKTKDDALESLLKDLSEPDQTASKTEKPAKAKAPKSDAGSSQSKGKENSAGPVKGKKAADSTGKPAARKSSDAGKVSDKDQALDELLGKLGETKDEPSADDRPRNGGPGDGSQPPPPARGEKARADQLGGKDKDLDERLEELTGRKRKRSPSDQERTGPVGEMIKQMREVEERLGKPDPSEDTQKKQKQIVKRIESMIEQAKQSGSSGRGMMVKRVLKPGQQPGQQPGDQTGAQARGAPPMKPAKPTSQHSTASGKDVWGHLPDELRQMMQSTFRETELDSKRELITRYFLSVGKGRLVRGE